MSKLKYGIVGLGEMATDAYLPASVCTDSARLVAVCDLNEGKVQCAYWNSPTSIMKRRAPTKFLRVRMLPIQIYCTLALSMNVYNI